MKWGYRNKHFTFDVQSRLTDRVEGSFARRQAFYTQNECMLQSPPTDISRNAYLSDATRFPPPTPLHILSKMPPLRTPLRSISGNRPKRSEISPYMRSQVIGKASEGADPTSIAKDLKLTRSTVNYTLQQDELRNDGHSLPRKPRKKSYTNTDERRILRHVRLNPKDIYQQVID